MTIFNLHLNRQLNHCKPLGKHHCHKLLDKMIFWNSTKNIALTTSTTTTTWWWLFFWKSWNIDENRQNLISKLEQVIEKSEKNEKFELDTSTGSYFNDAEQILDRNYLDKIENEKEELKEIEKEYSVPYILEGINEGVTPNETDFYFGGDK